MKIYEKAPAKINLSLDVLYKRNDGFHEVNMVMSMIDLSDRLTLSELHRDTIIISSQVGYIPLDEKNLAFKAAKLIKDRYDVKQGVHIHLDKKIPVSAGLAGGSSDAAATLRGLNRLWRLNIPIEELQRLGAELGSDIPFCIVGGTAIASGRGELIAPIASPPACWVVVAKPPISVSTPTIYRKVRTHTSKEDWANSAKPLYSTSVVEAIKRQDFSSLCEAIGNDLEAVTLLEHPEVRYYKESMQRLGAEGVLMSGSGPTVFGLVEKETKAVAIYNGLRGYCNEVYCVRLLT